MQERLINIKCPYNRKSETQMLSWSQEPSEENETVIKSGKQVTKYQFELMDCCQEQCGAWHNGRCCYACVSFNNE